MTGKLFLFGLLIFGNAALTFSQDSSVVPLADSKLPRTAGAVEKFVPAGWTIEARISGDLNNDAVADTALELIEKPAADVDKDDPPSRSRVLLILFRNKDGAFEWVAAAKTLLQCTRCGGAFYGVMEAPSEVAIAKGVLIIKQDHGSREVSETTFRFRYNPAVKKFTLIGYDASDRDRVTGEATVESTNYATGVKITETLQYNRKLDRDVKKAAKQTKVSKAPQYLEQINYETFGNN